MKVAAYQAPLLPPGSTEVALSLIRERVEWCESEGVEILCCPEGVLGGLADDAPSPDAFAIDIDSGQLNATLAPLASHRVTTIVGFTERASQGQLYNSAAILSRGSVIGVYRKLYPAINKSVYAAGDRIPVFTVGDLTFGIVICRDATFLEPVRIMAAQGAAALFVPTNNGLPPEKGGAELVAEARTGDRARAIENGVSVVRADVAGRTGDLVSHGSSGIVDRNGTLLAAAPRLEAALVVADIETTPREPRPGRDVSRGALNGMFDLAAELPRLLPRAIAWAEGEAAAAMESGRRLSATGLRRARHSGVQRPELVRVVEAPSLPFPSDRELAFAALQTGLLGLGTAGLTLGYAVFVLAGHSSNRLISHECRHVHQYEVAGSIGAFLPVYLQQIATYGYEHAPFEVDARAYEHDVV